ncbi:MAG: Nudix family hydrolase [Gammaproteobacteria bacterium]|jgi:8-oxo-dGTP diphosphatase
MSKAIHVAAAVIRNAAGDIFITLRPNHVHQGGLWEFPGGKVESGESVYDALVREIHEENGIIVQQARPLITIDHDYPDKRVTLDVWEVSDFTGTAHGREGQVCRWVRPQQLNDYTFPAANRPIVTAAQLPSTYLITPEPGDDTGVFVRQLESCLQRNIALVQLRGKQLTHERYLTLADDVIALCHRYQAKVLLNGPVELLSELPAADGIHLTSQRLHMLCGRPADSRYLVAASCHHGDDIATAAKLELDFVVLGPVSATASHPQAAVLGWDQFSRLTRKAVIPVFALGGVAIADVNKSRQCGGQGIAAIRSLWNTTDCTL